MPGTVNLRQGRIEIRSGDDVRLEKVAPFTEGDFSFDKPKNVIMVKTRGVLSHLRRGDEEPASFTFSAKLKDKTLRRCLEHFVWDSQTETISGLTPNANNPDVDLAYGYEQGSLAAASGEAISTKLAHGATPSGTNEYAEPIGALALEELPLAVDPGSCDIYPALGDTDMDVVYDAVGKSTLHPATGSIPADKKTFLIVLIKLDPADSAKETIHEAYELNHAYITNVSQGEGDEVDNLTFTGVGYVRKVAVDEFTNVIEVVMSDAIQVGDFMDPVFNGNILRDVGPDHMAVSDSLETLFTGTYLVPVDDGMRVTDEIETEVT